VICIYMYIRIPMYTTKQFLSDPIKFIPLSKHINFVLNNHPKKPISSVPCSKSTNNLCTNFCSAPKQSAFLVTFGIKKDTRFKVPIILNHSYRKNPWSHRISDSVNKFVDFHTLFIHWQPIPSCNRKDTILITTHDHAVKGSFP